MLARTSGDEFALWFTALGWAISPLKIWRTFLPGELMGIFRPPTSV